MANKQPNLTASVIWDTTERDFVAYVDCSWPGSDCICIGASKSEQVAIRIAIKKLKKLTRDFEKMQTES